MKVKKIDKKVHWILPPQSL